MAGHDEIDADPASWYLIQYTADLRKREQRNVGVLLKAQGLWRAKFFAEQEQDPGRVNGHRIRNLHLQKEAYEAWISYYRRKMGEDRWDEVERAQGRRTTNFSASLGGKIAGNADTDWDLQLRSLFSDLVAEPSATLATLPVGEQVKARAAELFQRANVDVERDVPAPARFGEMTSALVQVPFDFAFVNGQRHLAEALSLGGWTGRDRALAFNAQANAVRAAGGPSSFLALYDSDHVDPSNADVILAALEGVAHTIDMAAPEEAVETLREIAHHV